MNRIMLPQGSLFHLFTLEGMEIGKDDLRLGAMTRWMHLKRDLFQGQRILDLGSNCGHFPFVYQGLGASKIVAVEPRKQFGAVFQALCQHLPGDRIEWFEGDLRTVQLPFDWPDGRSWRYNVLSTLGIVYHLQDPWETLRPYVARKPDFWLVESMLFTEFGKVVEGGPDGDASKAFNVEEVDRPTAESVEAGIRSLGYEPERIDLGPGYRSESGHARGFWVARPK